MDKNRERRKVFLSCTGVGQFKRYSRWARRIMNKYPDVAITDFRGNRLFAWAVYRTPSVTGA